MREYENILVQEVGRVITITLNRPKRLNALSEGLQKDLTAALEQAEKDDNIGVVVVTGAPRADGRPCFSAGADIKEMQENGRTYSESYLGTLEEGVLKTLSATGEARDQWQFAWNRVQQFSKPLIAAIDGVCTAGGLELAMACDMRFVAETAEIRDLHMKNLGVLGGGGLQTWLPRFVGAGKAKDLIWTGDPLDGEQAVLAGFAERVFPSDKLLLETVNIAQKIGACSPKALRLSKAVINAGLSQGVYESLRFSAMSEALLRYMKQGDQEAFKRFVQKEK